MRLPFRSEQCMTPRVIAMLSGPIAKLEFDLSETSRRIEHQDETKYLEGSP